MGFVWNVILSFDNDEFWEDVEDQPRETCEPLERINAWLKHGRLVSLIGPTYKDDAGYGMDANLYGGGFKHFDIEGFIEVVKAQDWKVRSNVQLWIKGAERGWARSHLFRSSLVVEPVPQFGRRTRKNVGWQRRRPRNPRNVGQPIAKLQRSENQNAPNSIRWKAMTTKEKQWQSTTCRSTFHSAHSGRLTSNF